MKTRVGRDCSRSRTRHPIHRDKTRAPKIAVTGLHHRGHHTRHHEWNTPPRTTVASFVLVHDKSSRPARASKLTTGIVAIVLEASMRNVSSWHAPSCAHVCDSAHDRGTCSPLSAKPTGLQAAPLCTRGGATNAFELLAAFATPLPRHLLEDALNMVNLHHLADRLRQDETRLFTIIAPLLHENQAMPKGVNLICMNTQRTAARMTQRLPSAMF